MIGNDAFESYMWCPDAKRPKLRMGVFGSLSGAPKLTTSFVFGAASGWASRKMVQPSSPQASQPFLWQLSFQWKHFNYVFAALMLFELVVSIAIVLKVPCMFVELQTLPRNVSIHSVLCRY